MAHALGASPPEGVRRSGHGNGGPAVRVQTRHLHVTSVYRIIKHIMESEGGPIRLNELAFVAGLSRFHMTRVFAAMTGESVAEFARRIRLEHAALKLLTSRISIQELSALAGYSNSEAFTRGFRQHYGLPPSDFRTNGSVDWRLTAPSNIHWSDGPVRFQPQSLDLHGPEIEIMDRLPMHLIGLRHVGPYGDTHKHWPEVRDRLQRFLTAQGKGFDIEQLPSGPRFYTIFHDNCAIVHPSRARSDLAIAWNVDWSMPDGFRSVPMPGGIYLSTCEELPSEGYHLSWGALNDNWVPRRGQRPINTPCMNEYSAWPIPWSEARIRLVIGLDMDLGRP